MNQFPFEAYLQAKRDENNRKAQQFQQIAGLISQTGQTGGQLLQAKMQKNKQDKTSNQVTNFLNQQTAPVPRNVSAQGMTDVPAASYNPGTDQASPLTQPNPNAQLFNSLRGLPPQLAAKIIGPLIEQQQKGQMKSSSGKPMTTVYMDPNDPTNISETPHPGWIPHQTSQADALSKEINATTGKERDKYLKGRVDVWNRSIDTKQIDTLVKNVGLTPQNITNLQSTVARGQRALDVLSDPNVTWQKLNAANIDFGGIMQGGVPSADEIKNGKFPNWHESTAKWQTYITGDNPANVPDLIRKQMIDMVTGSTAVSQKFLNANSKFTRTMIEPTIKGGLSGKQQSSLDSIQNTLTKVGGQKSGSQRKIFNSPEEAEAANLPKGTRITINGRAAVIE